MTERGGAELNFQLLGSGGGSGLSTLRTTPAGIRRFGLEALYAVGVDGTRHLLVPLRHGEGSFPDRQSAGAHLVEERLVDEAGTEFRFLDVRCCLPRLERLFSSLVDEMVDELRADSGDPWLTCRGVLERWRELLGAERHRILGRQEIVGLLAELLVVEKIALRSPPRALEAWRGWERDKVDFQWGKTALEVKASSAREGCMVTIHGIDQLEISTGGTLHLLFMRLEAADEAGESLPQLLIRLVQRGVASPELHRRLATVGYDHADAEEYGSLRFRPAEQGLFVVDGSFPRLVRSSFASGSPPDRVSEVRYRLDLTGYPQAPQPAMERVLEALVGP